VHDAAVEPPPGLELDEGHQTLSTSALDATPQGIVHMPHATPWPFALTLALTVLAYGVLLSSWPVAAAGASGCAIGIAGWFWPRGETQET
jgi:hypothetical protein